MLVPAILYGLLAWRIVDLRGAAEGALGVACALLAFRGHVQISRWARRRSPADADQPPPLAWIAVTVAAVIAIVVMVGRGR